ncbi:MAG TPA: 3-oxoacyl-[acyl-carrier-protein] synthase III C-terminal domain-containing protein [Candidatus Acidoferrales bacterium]
MVRVQGKMEESVVSSVPIRRAGHPFHRDIDRAPIENELKRDLVSERPITIASTATAVPPNVLSRELVKDYIGGVFNLSGRRLDAILEVIDNSKIDRRYSIFPVDYLIEPRPLAQTSGEYREHAIALGRSVVQEALDRASITPQDVDLFITVSCTGVMIPSVDAYLAQQMGFRSNVRRLPITELGCAAGAAGLTRALEYLRAYPEATVLLAAIELPTLTFQRKDFSQANLISAVLFGDGAAAAVITGRDARGPAILDSESFLFPESIDAMGFDLRDTGFHIVLAKEVPQLIRDRIGGLVDDFLARHSLTRKQVKSWLLHPGGQKLLAYMEQELGLCRCEVEPSWDVLRDYGNLSSASVLFVLNEWLVRGKLNAGDRGLLAAFGPGFSAEMLLLQWN